MDSILQSHLCILLYIQYVLKEYISFQVLFLSIDRNPGNFFFMCKFCNEPIPLSFSIYSPFAIKKYSLSTKGYAIAMIYYRFLFLSLCVCLPCNICSKLCYTYLLTTCYIYLSRGYLLFIKIIKLLEDVMMCNI